MSAYAHDVTPTEIFDRIISDGKLSDKRAGSLPDGLWLIPPDENWPAHLKQYDLLAGELAKLYNAGHYSFHDADLVANVLWSDMIGRSCSYPESSGLSELLLGVFDAFDAGEWEYPGKFDDPVAQLTNPAIRAIVDELSGSTQLDPG